MATKKAGIPASIRVGPYTYPVVMSPETDELLDARRATGQWETLPKHRILIHDGQDEQRKRMSLWHEVMHAICDLPGMWFIMPRFHAAQSGQQTTMEQEGDSDLEELIANTLSPFIVQVLRDNPALVAYLTAPDDGS